MFFSLLRSDMNSAAPNPARPLPSITNDRQWLTLAVVWGLAVVAATAWWHLRGRFNLTADARPITADTFLARTQAMIDAHTVGKQGDVPIVQPPADSDVYLVARAWSWWPMLQLEKGRRYRLHLTSLDYPHGFLLAADNISAQVLPGYEQVIEIRPTAGGDATIVCSEYCGLGHPGMTSRILVR